MHVLFLPSWYPDSDQPINGIFFREQARTLKSGGFKVGVVASKLERGTTRRVERYSDDGINIIYGYAPALPITIKIWNLALLTASFYRLFREYEARYGKPDVIHVQSAVYSGPAALQISKRCGVPYVITEHFSGFEQEVIPPLNLALLKKVFESATGLAVVSPALGEALEQKMGRCASSWKWVPNMVDPVFRPVGSRTGNSFQFLNVGWLKKNKGHEDLLRAFAKAFTDKDDVELLIGGDGELLNYLRNLSSELGIQQRVKFLGNLTRSEVISRMQSCDAFVLSSHVETFGVVLIEAMACGKPCVATACGGPDSIVDDETGILVPVKDFGTLAMAMAKMKNGIDSYDETRIRESCLDRFGPETLVENLENLYKAAMRK